eukprot:173553-Hanusia_phi.AAC.5
MMTTSMETTRAHALHNTTRSCIIQDAQAEADGRKRGSPDEPTSQGRSSCKALQAGCSHKLRARGEKLRWLGEASNESACRL